MSSYPSLAPRAPLFPDQSYQHGVSVKSIGMNIGTGYGYPFWDDYRFGAYFIERLHTPVAPAVSNASFHQWKPVYASTGSTDRWWMFGQPKWRGTNGMPPEYPNEPDWFIGSISQSVTNFILIGWTIGVTRTDMALPTWPQGHPLGPRVSPRFANTKTWSLPGYDNLPHGHCLLVDLNIAWFNDSNCYHVTLPENELMIRHFNYWPDAEGYGIPAEGQPAWTVIDRGGALSVDYRHFGNRQEFSIPPRTKTVGGANTPAWCQTFSYIINGYHMPGGAIMNSTISGGPVPV